MLIFDKSLCIIDNKEQERNHFVIKHVCFLEVSTIKFEENNSDGGEA